MTTSEGHQTIATDKLSIPKTNMSVYEAIYQRRTVKQFTNTPLPDESLKRMLDAAVLAPNHRLTEPWRFFVLAKGGALRAKVADLTWELTYERVANPNPEHKERAANIAKQRVLDGPGMVYVYCVPGRDDEETQENYSSVSIAAHNLTLAAEAEGFSVDWTTGNIIKHPMLAETLGADPSWKIVVALFLGKPVTTPTSRRSPASEYVNWLK